MPTIDDKIRDMATKTKERTGVDIGFLLANSLGRVLKREAKDKSSRRVHADRDISHIQDWLVAAVVNDEPWLKRLGPDGVPLKLAKFGTFDQIVNEADKAMRKHNTRGISVETSGNVVHSFEDGWTVVRLQAPDELDMESRVMQHCVGHGSYDMGVENGTTGIYSLRDRMGKSHATVEVSYGDMNSVSVLEQIKGKQNAVPRKDYFERLLEWLDETSYSFPPEFQDIPPGWAIDFEGNAVDLATLAPGSTFNGNLSFNMIDEDRSEFERNQFDEGPIFTLPLPSGVTVLGSLTYFGKWNHRLAFPDGFSVLGDLSLNGVTVNVDRITGKALYLDNCYIERLPPEIDVATTIQRTTFSLEFEHGRGTIFRGFTTLGNCDLDPVFSKMKFEGSLHLDNISFQVVNSPLSELRVARDLLIFRSRMVWPKTMEVGGNLTLNGTTVFAWGGTSKSIDVGGKLHFHRSEIESLPDNIRVGGAFELTDVKKLKAVPENAVLEGDVILRQSEASLGNRSLFRGGLSISMTSVDAFPDDMRVAGDFEMTNVAVGRLPKGLRVGKSLKISGPSIGRIPPDTTIGEHLVLTNSDIVAVPEWFVIPGDLDIRHHKGFRIAPGVRIGGALLARNAALETLPGDLSVTHVIAPYSGLLNLPKGLEIEGDLDIKGTSITSIPDDMYVGGYADFSETQIMELPSGASFGGSVILGSGEILSGTNSAPSPRCVNGRF